MAMLRITDGPALGRKLELDEEIVIGRENADLTIADPELSRRHAAFRPSGDAVEVEDLGSLNGTFIEGERIEGSTRLEANATIKLGTTLVAVEFPVATPDVTVARPIIDEPAPFVTAPRRIATEPPPAEPPPAEPPEEPRPDVTAPRAIPEEPARNATTSHDVSGMGEAPPPAPDVTAPRQIPRDPPPAPDVTAPRQIPRDPPPAPDVTAPRQIARPAAPAPDVTAPRRDS